MSWVKRLFPSGGGAPEGGTTPPDPTPRTPPRPLRLPTRRRVRRSPPSPASGREAVLRLEDVMRVQAVTASILTKKVNPRELFRHIVDGAADCLNADEASLMLVEGDTLRVVSARKAGEHVTVRLGRTKIGEGVAGWVAREGQALLLNEGDDFSRFDEVPAQGRADPVVGLGAPLRGRAGGRRAERQPPGRGQREVHVGGPRRPPPLRRHRRPLRSTRRTCWRPSRPGRCRSRRCCRSPTRSAATGSRRRRSSSSCRASARRSARRWCWPSSGRPTPACCRPSRSGRRGAAPRTRARWPGSACCSCPR